MLILNAFNTFAPRGILDTASSASLLPAPSLPLHKGMPIYEPNPLSLAIPDATFDAWAREVPLAESIDRRHGAGPVSAPTSSFPRDRTRDLASAHRRISSRELWCDCQIWIKLKSITGIVLILYLCMLWILPLTIIYRQALLEKGLRDDVGRLKNHYGILCASFSSRAKTRNLQQGLF